MAGREAGLDLTVDRSDGAPAMTASGGAGNSDAATAADPSGAERRRRLRAKGEGVAARKRESEVIF